MDYKRTPRRDSQPDQNRSPYRQRNFDRPPPPRFSESENDEAHIRKPLCPDPAQKLPIALMQMQTSHPLLFRTRMERVDHTARAGDWVEVHHSKSEMLGYGIYNPRADIAIRMFRWGRELPDEAFWQARLQAAVALRRDMLRLDEVTDAYRVIHAEADGFSGLVVDKLGDTLSAEVFSLGMFQRAEQIVEKLAALCGTKHSIIRCAPQTFAMEGFEAEPIASPELPPRVTINEFGTRFRVRFEGGHKTGFFCDQRDNRKMLASFCRGKSVLDLCCYTGGFAIQAKRLGQAEEVTGVDLDEEPLKLARENANLNQCRVNFVQADAFAYMRDMLALGRQYDVVVLDPPKLITNRDEIEEGTRKHFDINRLAIQLVRPGGLLLSCTCAGLLTTEEFHRLLYGAARQAGPPDGTLTPNGKPRHTARPLQILAKTGASADHPVSSHCLETEYLRAVWVRVE